MVPKKSPGRIDPVHAGSFTEAAIEGQDGEDAFFDRDALARPRRTPIPGQVPRTHPLRR